MRDDYYKPIDSLLVCFITPPRGFGIFLRLSNEMSLKLLGEAVARFIEGVDGARRIVTWSGSSSIDPAGPSQH